MSEAVNPYEAPENLEAVETEEFAGTYSGYGRLKFFLLSIACAFLTIIPILGIILYAAGIIFVARKRFENIGKNPNLGWLHILPIINIWTAFNCIVYPTGYAQHKTLDTAAKVIIGLYVLTILAAVGGIMFGVMAK